MAAWALLGVISQMGADAGSLALTEADRMSAEVAWSVVQCRLICSPETACSTLSLPRPLHKTHAFIKLFKEVRPEEHEWDKMQASLKEI